MNVVDKLVIALGIDTKGVDKGISEAQSKLTAGFKGIMGKVFAPLMAGMSFAGIFDSIYAELKQMNSLSKTTKTNIEDITAWSRAVNISGGSVEDFSQTLMFLNQNLTRIAVTGHSRIKPFFEKLGVDATELAKKPVLESLEAIGKAIDGMDKRESANMLRAMGFDGGTIKLLQSGEKGIRELIARQRELGVYTEKDAKAFSAMNKSFKEITSSIKTLFIPAVMLILNVSSRVVQYLTTGIQYLRKNIDVLRGALVILSAVFYKQLLQAILNFGTMLMANPFGMFMVGLTAVLLLLEDLWTYATGGESAFEGLWEKLGTPKEVLEGFKAVGNAIETVAKFLGKTENVMVTVLAFFTAAVGMVLSAVMPVITAIVAAVGWIPLAIVAVGVALAALLQYIYNHRDKVIRAFNAIATRIKAVGTSIYDSIAGAIDGALAWIKDGINGIFSYLQEIGKSVDASFTEAFNYVTGLFDGLVDDFNSGCSAIAGFLSNAADTARNAWAGFISWLEKKWNWLKGLLPSFESIANKLPKLETGVKLATKAGSGGTTNNTNVNDRRNITNHYHNAESVKQGRKEQGFVSYADTGWAGP